MTTKEFERFKKYASVPDIEGCMIWTGNRHSEGYGTLSVSIPKKRTMKYAHRLSYEHFIGPIPAGLHIDHLCRNRPCVNPTHLEPVTCRLNLLRGIGHAAVQAKRTHCPKGHPYDGDNLITFEGHRQCRECHREFDRLPHRRKRKAERAAGYTAQIVCEFCGVRVELRKQYRPQRFCSRSCAAKSWRLHER